MSRNGGWVVAGRGAESAQDVGGFVDVDVEVLGQKGQRLPLVGDVVLTVLHLQRQDEDDSDDVDDDDDW